VIIDILFLILGITIFFKYGLIMTLIFFIVIPIFLSIIEFILEEILQRYKNKKG